MTACLKNNQYSLEECNIIQNLYKYNLQYTLCSLDTNPNYSNFKQTEKCHTQEKKKSINGDKTRDDEDVRISRTDFKADTVTIFKDIKIC